MKIDVNKDNGFRALSVQRLHRVELRRITDKLADVQEYIAYLTRPITEASHVFYNHTRSLHGLSERAIAVPSPEDTIMEDQEQQECRKLRQMPMEGLGSCLTPAQRRRLWLHCVDELTVRQIAEAGNVRHPNVVECLTAFSRTGKSPLNVCGHPFSRRGWTLMNTGGYSVDKKRSEKILQIDGHEVSINDEGQAVPNALNAQYEDIISWAEMYDQANLEAKKMIVNCLIKRVEVYRDYKLHIDFNIDLEQFSLGKDIVTIAA